MQQRVVRRELDALESELWEKMPRLQFLASAFLPAWIAKCCCGCLGPQQPLALKDRIRKNYYMLWLLVIVSAGPMAVTLLQNVSQRFVLRVDVASCVTTSDVCSDFSPCGASNFTARCIPGQLPPLFDIETSAQSPVKLQVVNASNTCTGIAEQKLPTDATSSNKNIGYWMVFVVLYGSVGWNLWSERKETAMKMIALKLGGVYFPDKQGAVLGALQRYYWVFLILVYIVLMLMYNEMVESVVFQNSFDAALTDIPLNSVVVQCELVPSGRPFMLTYKKIFLASWTQFLLAAFNFGFVSRKLVDAQLKLYEWADSDNLLDVEKPEFEGLLQLRSKKISCSDCQAYLAPIVNKRLTEALNQGQSAPPTASA